MRVLLRALALAATATLLAGCGLGGRGDDDDGDRGVGGGGPVTSPSAATAAPATVAVNKSFWFAGFKITLGTATLTPRNAGGLVDVETTFENLGSRPRAFDADLALTTGGSAYEADHRHQPPTVPPGATTKGTLGFALPAGVSIEGATLTAGGPTQQQATVPFGSTGTLKSLEPVRVPVTAPGGGGDLAVDLTGGELRADVLENHRQVAAGKLSLGLKFAVTYKGPNRGGYAFSHGGNLFLQLPDGTRVAAQDGPIELLRQNATVPDLAVYFLVGDPPAGGYALVVHDDRTRKEGTIPFTIGSGS